MNRHAGIINYLLLFACLCQHSAQAQEWPDTFGFGETASADEIAAWDIDVKPDGQGLPAGGGTVDEGAALYAANCAVCHGKTGVEGPNDRLVVTSADESFPDASDVNAWQHRTIGNYWPYATTLFDYIRRSMPMNIPGSLEANEVYALTAYLLYLNHIVAADTLLDAANLAEVAMPARDRFVPDNRQDYREVH